jgi:hypothetical protein
MAGVPECTVSRPSKRERGTGQAARLSGEPQEGDMGRLVVSNFFGMFILLLGGALLLLFGVPLFA